MKRELLDNLRCPKTKLPLKLKDGFFDESGNCLEGKLINGDLMLYCVNDGFLDFIDQNFGDANVSMYNLRRTSYVDKLIKLGWSYESIASMDGLRFSINKLLSGYLNHYLKGDVLEVGAGGNYLKRVYSNKTTSWISSDYDLRSLIDIRCDAQSLPFNDSLFDVVICIDVLEHVENPALMISELARVLKNDGILILSTPFFFYLHEAPYDFYRFSKYGLKSLMNRFGLETLDLKPTAGVISTFGIMLTASIVHLLYRIKILCNFILILNKYFQIFLLPLDRFFNRNGRLSQGHFVIAKKSIIYE
jgi:SAM-dependent methyltransferase/uncharacterized protein YbaR (Trm112 family)